MLVTGFIPLAATEIPTVAESEEMLPSNGKEPEKLSPQVENKNIEYEFFLTVLVLILTVAVLVVMFRTVPRGKRAHYN